MKQLTEKVAIVTGASAGIGRATARLFAQEGAKVVLTARRKERLDALVDEISSQGGQAIALAGDIKDEQHAKALVELAIQRFGRLDIAFNNAAIMGPSVPATELSSSQWREVIETNLTSAFVHAKYQIPAIQQTPGGSIIFTSSFVGYNAAFPGMSAYAASKAGLIGLMQVLALELGGQGIRVNALLPGGTDTEMNVANAPGAGPEVLDFLHRIHPLGRIAKAEEIAKAALFLASDASSFMTGSAMVVDGGVSLSKT